MKPNEQTLEAIKNYLTNYQSNRALLLVGKPGLGKTYLCKQLPELLGVSVVIYNASLNRDKDFFHKIAQESVTHDVSSKQKVLVLDECEGLPTKQLTKLIKDSSVPIILVCNFLDEIDWRVRKECDVVKVSRPPDWIFEQYLGELSTDFSKEENTTIIPKSVETLKNIARKARSFRHARHLLEGEEDSEFFLITVEQIEYSLRGGFVEHWQKDPEELLTWMFDTVTSAPEKSLFLDSDFSAVQVRTGAIKLITQANHFLGLTKATRDYHYWKYCYQLLGLIRSANEVVYPRSFRLVGEIKRANSQQSLKVSIVAVDTPKIVNVETFSNVEIVQIKKSKEDERDTQKLGDWI